MHHWDPTKHMARKRHYCDSCCASVEPGDKYLRQRWVDGGDAGAYKAHDRCHRVMNFLWDQGIRDESDMGGECWRNLHDMEPEDWQLVAGKVNLIRPFIEVGAVLREMSDIEGFKEQWHATVKFCGRNHLIKRGILPGFGGYETDDPVIRGLMLIEFIDDVRQGREEPVHA